MNDGSSRKHIPASIVVVLIVSAIMIVVRAVQNGVSVDLAMAASLWVALLCAEMAAY